MVSWKNKYFDVLAELNGLKLKLKMEQLNSKEFNFKGLEGLNCPICGSRLAFTNNESEIVCENLNCSYDKIVSELAIERLETILK